MSNDEHPRPNPTDLDAPTLIPNQASPPEDDLATLLPGTEPAIAQRGVLNEASTALRYFGDYELLSEIARGGMGVVYKARQVNLNRLVALKMILAGQLASSEDVQRFYTEAEAAASLDHPGIVPIYEIGQHNDQHFFSMGYIDGSSLADHVKNGPLSPKDSASFTQKIAEAIAYAHEKGVIHRDLKPANVLLDKSGEPKVTDFGLARKSESNSDLTRTGAVMGTPSYMPPEQAAGRTNEVGPLADVYSLGAILYCLMTGRPPFQAANPIDTIMQVLDKEPIAPRELVPLIPKDLETICLKCLQKDSAKRYVSASALADDLSRWQRGEPIHARAISRLERTWRWVKRNPGVTTLSTAAGILAVMLAIGGPIAAVRQANLRKEAEESALKAEEQRKIAEQERHIAEDQRMIALMKSDEAQLQQKIAFEESEKAKHSEMASRQAQLLADDARKRAEESEQVANASRAEAYENEAKAKLAAQEAMNEREKAVALAENIQRQQRLQAVERAGDYLKQDDWYGAHFWFTQAVPPKSPANKKERTFALKRLDALWQRLPMATHFWSLPARPVYLDLLADERSIVAVDVSQDAYVFNPETGLKIAGPFHQQTTIWNATMDPSKERMVTVGGSLGISGEIGVWDIAKGEKIAAFSQPLATFLYAKFLEGGKRILTADINLEGKGQIKIWDLDLESRKLKKAKNTISFFPGSLTAVSEFIDARTGNVLVYELDPTDPLLARMRIVHSVSGKTVGELDISKQFPNMRHGQNFARFVPKSSLVRMFHLNEKEEWCVHIWDPSGARPQSQPMVLTMGEPTQIWLVENSDLAVVKTTARRHLIYSTTTGQLQWQLNAPAGTEVETVYSDDGRFAAIPLADGRVQVWDVLTNQATSASLRHGESVSSMFFDKQGRRLITVTKDGAVRIWDFATTYSGFAYELPAGWNAQIKGLPDGDFAVSSQGQWVQYWKRESEDRFGLNARGQATPNASKIAFSETEIYATANNQARIDISKLSSGDSKTIYAGETGRFLRQITLSRDGKLVGGLFTKTLNGPTAMLGELNIWETSNGNLLQSGIRSTERNLLDSIIPSQVPNLSGILSFAFDSKGERIAIGCGSATTQGVRGETKIIDVKTGKVLGKTLPMTVGSVPLVLEFHPKQNSLLVAGGSPTTNLIEFVAWNLDTAEENHLESEGRSSGNLTPASALMRFSSDGSTVAIKSENQLELYDGNTFQRRLTPIPHPTSIESCFFHPTLPLVVTMCKDQSVRVWDTDTGNLFTPVIETAGAFSSLDFTNYDLLVAVEVVNGTNRLRVWNFRTQVHTLERHQQIARAFTGLTHDGSAVGLVDSSKMQQEWTSVREAFPKSFAPNQYQVYQWTGMIVDDCEQKKMRASAISYLRPFLLDFPDDPNRHRRLANLCGDEGRYELAAEHFKLCNELLSAKNQFYADCVQEEITAWIAAGQQEKYALACEAAVKRYQDSNLSYQLERIAKGCFLRKDCPVDLSLAIAMSERALKLDNENSNQGLDRI